jgi:outer membrane protein assembly factor BamA
MTSRFRHIFLVFHVLFFATVLHAEPETLAQNAGTPPGQVIGNNQHTPPVIDSVGFEGIGNALADSLSPFLLTKPGGILNEGYLAYDRNIIETMLRERGYWGARTKTGVDSTGTSGIFVTFHIDVGPLTILGTVAVTGPDNAARWKKAASPPPEGATFTSTLLKSYLDALTGEALMDGYPDSFIHPVLTARSDTIDVRLDIEPGRQAVIDSVVISGLVRTNAEVVHRELARLLGSRADRTSIEAARLLIASLDIVLPAGIPSITYPPGGGVWLLVPLTEGPQGSFDGVAGYQPDGSGGGELIGTADVMFPNLLGTGRSASFHWENLGKNIENLAIGYREPWLFGRPYAIEGSFKQEERGQFGYSKTMMGFSLIRRFGAFEAGAGYRYEKTSADSLTSASAHGFELNAQRTVLDNRTNPLSGYRYSAAWSSFSKSYRFGSYDPHHLERVTFDMEHYIPTKVRQTAAILVRYRRVTAPEGSLTAADRLWLGGASSIRGYREQQFPAIEAAWANIEYRFLMEGRSRVFLFVDYGYLVNEESSGGKIRKNTINRTGYGFGLRVESRAGLLGFDFGMGKGDTFADGKLHVSLSSYF